MSRIARNPLVTTMGTACIAIVATVLMSMGSTSLPGAEAEPPAGPEAAPPANQQYTGSKRCASCHFEQYMTWKTTNHAKAFEDLTPKYQKDPKCLKCHTTGFGEPSGYKDQATTAVLAGVTCESCHGPGSEHEKIAQPFAKVKTLTPEQEKAVKDSIWLMLPKNVCVECHVVQGHKENPTPKELRPKK